MSEIEKMQRYIKRTKLKESDTGPYKMNMVEAFELVHQARKSDTLFIEMIALAFEYGKAKGYRAAKAEVRA